MSVTALTQSDFTPKTHEQARRHFAAKTPLTSEEFDALSAAAKAHAFRIATVHKASLVQYARDVIEASIAEAIPWSEVQRDLLALFDVEGVPRPALHRLRAMFQQNTQQAYNDARRATLDDPDVVEAFPYREYLTVGNGVPGVNNVRPEHAALHGKVFAWDDPFWDDHTPPWDWGCRCTTIALTERQVERGGIKVLDLDYVRTKLRVPGTNERGITANPDYVRGKIDLRGLDAEMRRAVDSELGGHTV